MNFRSSNLRDHQEEPLWGRHGREANTFIALEGQGLRSQQRLPDSSFFHDDSRIHNQSSSPIHTGLRTPQGSGKESGSRFAGEPEEDNPLAFRMRLPPHLASDPTYRSNCITITSPQDKAMAEKQLRIDTLSDSERRMQHKWAKAHLAIFGGCVEGYAWHRFESDNTVDGAKIDWYRCWAGGHVVTHELLVEDRGRHYSLGPLRHLGRNVFVGPLYPYPRRGGLFRGQGRSRDCQKNKRPPWADNPDWSPIAMLDGESGRSKKSRR